MSYTKDQQYVDIVNILYEDWKNCQPREDETFLDILPYHPLKEKLTLNSETNQYETT